MSNKNTKEISSRYQERLAQVVLGRVITEKSARLEGENQYTFLVDPKSDKSEIKDAIEWLYSVSVEKVATSLKKPVKKLFRGKPGSTKLSKKAVVTVKNGQVIEFGEVKVN